MRTADCGDREPHFVYRPIPAPYYDIAGTESWLEAMAARGLHLSEDGFFLGLGVFARGLPRQFRYRLTVSGRKRSFLAEDRPEDEGQAELAKAFGWDYVCSRQGFSVYRTEDPAAPELNTDPAIQAMTLKRVEKDLRGSAIIAALYFVLFGLGRRFAPLHAAAAVGSWFLLWLLVLAAGMLLVLPLLRLRFLVRERKALLQTGTLAHDGGWQRRGRRYLLRKGIWSALWLGFLLCFLIRWGTGTLTPEADLPPSARQEPFPFATLAELFPEGRFTRDETDTAAAFSSNVYRESGDWLAPEIIQFKERGTVTLPDGASFSVTLYVDYYKTPRPWVARLLAKERIRYDRLRGSRRHWKAIPLGPVDADLAEAYTDFFPTLILQKGCQLVEVTWFADTDAGDTALTPQRAAELLAESLR